MKIFFKRISIYAISSILLQILLFEVLFGPKGSPTLSLYFSSNLSWLSIYSRVQSSHKHASYEHLIIGDSVASQLFPYINKKGFSTSKNFLTTNGAVLSAGNYILCHNVIRNNPRLKYIVYLSVPDVIGHKFERSRTCNNFVKPFFEISSINIFDRYATNKILAAKYNMFYLFKLYKCLPFDEFNYFDNSREDEFEMSRFSLQYLVKLRDLCEASGKKLIILSSPIPETKFKKFKKYENKMRQQIIEAGLQEPFKCYFDELHFYPDEYFKDGLHFTKAHLSIRHNEQKRIMAIANAAYYSAKNHPTLNTSFQ